MTNYQKNRELIKQGRELAENITFKSKNSDIRKLRRVFRKLEELNPAPTGEEPSPAQALIELESSPRSFPEDYGQENGSLL